MEENEDIGLEPNIEAEQALLGALFMNDKLVDEVRDILQDWHFFDPLHGRIYRHIVESVEFGFAVDPMSISATMKDDEALKEIGGRAYLSGLGVAAISVMPSTVIGFAREIVAFHRRQKLFQSCQNIMEMAADRTLSLAELTGEAEAVLSEALDDARPTDRILTLSTAINGALEEATRASLRDSGVVGVHSGLSRLDAVTGGFRAGNLIVLAGRPGMGKSAVAVSFGIEGIRQSHDPIGGGMISLEMNADELAFRVLSMGAYDAGVELPYSKISRGQLTGGETIALDTSQKAMRDLPFLFEDAGKKTVGEIRSIARKMDRDLRQQGRKLGILFVDHLGLIRPTSNHRGNKVAEIEEITNDLKALAKSLNIPVVALSQLSREVERRDDKRPVLSDLRNSGSIEQDADSVIFVYRPRYYLERSKPYPGTPEFSEWELDFEKEKNDLHLIVAKNRHGESTTVKVFTDISCNVVKDERPGAYQQSAMEGL